MSIAKSRSVESATSKDEVRERILRVASELFYSEGAHAVGVDLVVERAGVAKTSLYRHFGSKDELIAAFLHSEDEEFWKHWQSVARQHQPDAQAELDAHMQSIAERVGRQNYRGCPQLNIAAEFSDATHPARVIALLHKQRLRRYLEEIAGRLHVPRPHELAAQLLLLVNGAFVSSSVIGAAEAPSALVGAARALVTAARLPL